VLGVGFGFALIAALLFAVVASRARTIDPQEQLERWFEPVELPFGLAPVEAARQPGGETLLRLADPDAPPEAPRAKREQGTRDAPVDWAALESGPEGTPPTEALLVTWPLQAAASQLESLFSPTGGDPFSGGGPRRGMPGIFGSGDPLAGLGSQGGRRVLERGLLRWGALEAPYALERSFEPGGTFVDTVRLNLSTEREPLALFLRWPRSLPASTERAEELLASLRRPLLPSDEDG